MYYVRMTKDKGRGVFANQDIKTGDVITNCELIVLDKADTILVEDTSLKYYTFKYNSTQDCLVLGDGEIFNHSNKPNVSYNLITITDSLGSRKIMQFKALRPILQDEQMYIDYAADEPKTKVGEYCLNLMGELA